MGGNAAARHRRPRSVVEASAAVTSGDEAQPQVRRAKPLPVRFVGWTLGGTLTGVAAEGSCDVAATRTAAGDDSGTVGHARSGAERHASADSQHLRGRGGRPHVRAAGSPAYAGPHRAPRLHRDLERTRRLGDGHHQHALARRHGAGARSGALRHQLGRNGGDERRQVRSAARGGSSGHRAGSRHRAAAGRRWTGVRCSAGGADRHRVVGAQRHRRDTPRDGRGRSPGIADGRLRGVAGVRNRSRWTRGAWTSPLPAARRA